MEDAYYEGQYDDVPIAQTIERVVFFSGEDADTVAADDVLWTADEVRLKLAHAVLQHSTQREPTRALTEAFVPGFKGVFDDDGMGWVLSYRDLKKRLAELGVRG